MRTRNSPNLYEILRSASGPAILAKEHPPEPAPAALPPPPPPAPAPVLEAAPPPPPSALELFPPPPRPVEVIERPAPAPRVSEAHSSEPAVATDPGERAVRVTYNTLLFSGLVALGVVILAFTLGVRTGRSHAEAASAPAAPEAPVPDSTSGPAPKFTIQLIEYRARTSQEYTKAIDAATRYKLGLERAGYRGAVVDTLGQVPDRRIVLRFGEFADANSAPALETFRKLQGLRFDREPQAPFARTARFVTQ